MSSLAASSSSLKSAQLTAVNRMLAFNEDVSYDDDEYKLPPAGSSHNQWKILIYDAPCRSIISPLLSVSQLRRRGVTLHLLLNSEREPIPDVPAVYFVSPTKENLTIIGQDCAKGLYGRAHLNFVTKLDRSLMEEFARLVVQTGSLDTIASVHDQYLDYVCLERNLFSLHKKNSYVTYNGSGATEQSMEAAMTEIAYGLFSVVATLGCVPIIRCPKGGAPEMVARKLNRMVAEHPTLLRSKKSSLTRPLLVIMDRNSDLITPIQHASTYQALIDDLLTHNANRVEFVVTQDANGKRPKKTTKKFDLDPDKDPFYSNHKFQPFPEAIESNGVELQDVTQKEQQIRSKTANDGAPTTLDPLANTAANDLATAVDSLPALLDRKKQLEVHTSILQAVMNEVAARDVPQFYELEMALATGTYSKDPTEAKQNVLELVSDPTKGNIDDKIRLVLVFGLATTAKSADMDEVANAMKQGLESSEGFDNTARKQLDAGIHAVQYVKQLRSMHMIPSMAMEEMESSQASSGDMLSSLVSRASRQSTALFAKATAKMGNILGKTHKHRATQVVENLCDMKPNTEDDEYLYLDPKVKGDVDINALRTMTRAPVRQVIAFMIGGGCYSEYQNLQMVANERRTVSYGSTELVTPCQFLAQLEQLG